MKVITGIRRCGKSVLLNEIYYDYLLADGVPSDHIIKVSLDLKKWEALRDGDALYHFVAEAIGMRSYIMCSWMKFSLWRDLKK